MLLLRNPNEVMEATTCTEHCAGCEVFSHFVLGIAHSLQGKVGRKLSAVFTDKNTGSYKKNLKLNELTRLPS